ncbi:MAG: hypothetical protein IE916_11085 [Epsilonproteobacteria bacterium]|nr:hypothetical protein [Campylobacterota bacterium]
MQLQELYQKLHALKSQKASIEDEILKVTQLIEQCSPFSKSQKVTLFKSLFIGREDVCATYWVNKEGTKKDIHLRLILLEEQIISLSTMLLSKNT